MKSLVVEDEFVARSILQSFLARHGECDVAVDGSEAVAAVDSALRDGAAYEVAEALERARPSERRAAA